MVDAEELRAMIATLLLDAGAAPRRSLGAVTLLPHQVDAVRRLRLQLAREGGALLADEVGLGKTFVALALAAEATRPLIVAPAALRQRWRDALARAGVDAPILSYQALSRDRSAHGEFDLVILDEAHHARTATTIRYRRLCALTRHAHVLMLSATPIHNSAKDLRTLLALYMGSEAFSVDEHGLARQIVRRGHAQLDLPRPLPRLLPPDWIRLPDDDGILRDLLAIPPPLPPSDGGEGGVLLALGLARLWTSSRAALRAALRRRLARTIALEGALEARRHPSASELGAWSAADDVVQLAFPQLVSAPAACDTTDWASLGERAAAHADAIRTLLTRLRAGDDIDGARARAVAAIRARHAGARVVAFTQFIETARMFYRALGSSGGCCLLTSRGATVAGGSIPRSEALAAFAPRAFARRPAGSASDITLLIATDLLSEGLDLHDASVIVHLDLPWTAARLEQRVGRIRRLGSRHRSVYVHALAPPASAESLLRLEERLRAKLSAAGRVVGAEPLLMPRLPTRAAAAPHGTEHIRMLITRWRAPEAVIRTDGRSLTISAVQTDCRGWLAVVKEGGRSELIGCGNGQVGSTPELLQRLVRCAEGPTCRATPAELRRALTEVRREVQRRAAAEAAGVRNPAALPSRAALLRRIAEVVSEAPLHRRTHVARAAARAREAVMVRHGAGEEAELVALATDPDPGEPWLDRVARLAPASDGVNHPDSARRPRLLALLLLALRISGARAPSPGNDRPTESPFDAESGGSPHRSGR